MKIILILLSGIIVAWPFICWFSYHMVGWKVWEMKFARKQTGYNTMIAVSVWLKKFGSYNRVISVGIEDYGIAFIPSRILLFHKSFYIPWGNIFSYQLIESHSSTKCVLNTNIGTLTIKGDIAEIVARGCESHYVSKR